MKRRHLYILLCLCLAIVLSYHLVNKGPVARPIKKFIDGHFVLRNGGVLIENTDRNTVLSESTGLYLVICVILKDRAAFDRTYMFIKKELVSDRGVLYWKIDLKTGKKERSSASIDDLRVIRALLMASDAWKDEYYLKEALALADAVKKTQVRNGYLVESFTWENTDSSSQAVKMSYLDLFTMKMLSRHDPAWGSVYEKSVKLIGDSVNAAGLLREEYDIESKNFSYGDGNMINQLMASLYLCEAGVPAPSIALSGFLTFRLDRDGKIYNMYDEKGRPASKNECAAVYALASRLFGALKNATYRKIAFAKMLSFEVKDSRNRYYGGFGLFGPYEKKTFNSFDSFQAFLTATDRER